MRKAILGRVRATFGFVRGGRAGGELGLGYDRSRVVFGVNVQKAKRKAKRL